MATKKGTAATRTQKKNAKAPGRSSAKSRGAGGGAAEARAAAGDAEPSKRGKKTSAPAERGRHGAGTQRARPDPRLPEPGTVLRKTDRLGNVRCECTVQADGIRYGGKVYRSLSAAAVAAAADLGIKGAQNGYIFWGLSKPARAGEDPLTRLQKSWARYEVCARTVIATAPSERRSELVAAIERHRSVEIAPAA